MRALCRRAPIPIYTGKPAPVIFTPRSKSIRLYFFASSQCGSFASAFSGLRVQLPTVSVPSHSFRLLFTTILSSAATPSGTSSYGMFGIVQSSSLVCLSASSIACSMALSWLFSTAT